MAEFKILRSGSEGPQVQLLQLALSRAGFDPLGLDGIFGSGTYSAVRKFQMSFGMDSDGIVGPVTWSKLMPYLTGYTNHVVRRGDTLYRLAITYGTTLRAIEAANPGMDPLELVPGKTITVPLGFEVVPTNISFTSTVLELCITGLKARYPFLEVSSIGQSVMGKWLYCIRIGTGNNQVFHNASHHANEWITSPLLMKYLEKYSRAYSSGSTIFNTDSSYLFNTTSLYIVPMVNPDGVDLVTGELSSGEYYEQAKSFSEKYPSIPFPSGWKANIDGIDPNLQYPANWEKAKEIKYSEGYISPAPRDFVGAFPLQAPESRAVYNFTLSKNFSITLSYHTQGQVIYWKYLDYLPNKSYEIANEFAALSGYSAELTPAYSAYAGYKDWFIMRYNRPGYTIEAGEGISPLPISQFAEIYSDNEGILTYSLTATI